MKCITFSSWLLIVVQHYEIMQMEKTWKNKSRICCGAKKSVSLKDTVILLELSWESGEQAGR